MTNIGEIWKDVVGYEGFYLVSNTGKIKRTSKILPMNTPNGGNYHKTEKILSPNYNRQGYERVNLIMNGIHKTTFTHRIVARSFCENPDNKPHVNHIDFNPANNKASNLEWVTRSENVRHTIKAGRGNRNMGEKCHKSVLNKDQVLEIRELKGTHRSIAMLYKVTSSTISAIKNKRNWKHIQ